MQILACVLTWWYALTRRVDWRLAHDEDLVAFGVFRLTNCGCNSECKRRPSLEEGAGRHERERRADETSGRETHDELVDKQTWISARIFGSTRSGAGRGILVRDGRAVLVIFPLHDDQIEQHLLPILCIFCFQLLCCPGTDSANWVDIRSDRILCYLFSFLSQCTHNT